jgi:hypothetical protein
MQKLSLKKMGLTALCAALALPALVHAQMPAQQSSSAKSDASAPFDPHDLSGMWEFFANIPGQGIYATPSKTPPPMTPWAKARYDEAKPGYGPKAQAGGNDPILKCYPTGIPRILFFPQPLEIYQSPQRTFMFFERDHAWRQIWTDGRSHPSAMEPTWMGDSIGKWEGDTFVVDTIGLTEKSWLDFYGDPHSDDLHLIERYKRVDHDSLTIQLVVEDPKAYTATWTGDIKTYKLLKGKKAYMEELPCIPDEEDAFTNRIRMPAAGQPPKQ